jgi:restriction endonuclease S subunit
VTIAKVETCTNQGYKNFVCNPDVLYYEYLYYVLRHEAKNIEAIASGMTYPEISKSEIGDYRIPLPSIPEQEKIVVQIEIEEQKIATAQARLDSVAAQKAAVLKKYL